MRLLTLVCTGLFLGNCSAAGLVGQNAGERGQAALRSGDYARAGEYFVAALRADPKDAAVQAGLMAALRCTGEYAEAARRGAEFLASGGAPQVRLEVGRISKALGRYAEAEGHFREARAGAGRTAWDAERELADLFEKTGRRAEATPVWQAMIERYRRGQAKESTALGQAAVAAWRLGYVNDAKEIFLDATEPKPGREVLPEVLNDFGYLFVEKYNATDAIGCFRDCLKINPAFAPALLGMALAKKYESNAEAENFVRAALKVNPHYAPARCLLADLRYQEEDYEAGLLEVRRALDVNPQDLEALSLQAVYCRVRGDNPGFEAAEKSILRINPSYGELYYTLGEDLVMRRKYREAVEQYRHAVTLDSALWPAYSALGINLMRVGSLDEGRRMLERAFEGDPFNVWAYNTLDLLDQMDKFVRVQAKDFTFLLAKEDEAVIGPYLTRLAEEAYASLSRRYGFTPRGPLQVEVFPDHGGFAVRTLGLPGLGALGVCFGQVVAMDSPRAQKQGAFNWGSTFWHEFAHVITLQMTNHNIPRWYSEGLSVYEERHARPGWGDDLSAGFVKAFKEGKLLKVHELNAGLMRPKFPEQIAYSYYQSFLFCELIDERFGFDKIRQSLELFAQNKPADEVFRQSLGWDPDTLEREYSAFLTRRLQGVAAKLDFPQESGEGGMPGSIAQAKAAAAARLKKNPDDFFANLQMGVLLLREGAKQEGEACLRKAQSLFPEYVDSGNSYQALSELYLQEGREEDALAEFLGWARYDESAPLPLVRAAEILRKRQAWDDVVRTAERSVFAYPYTTEVHQMLGDAASESGDWSTAVMAYQARVGLNPPDMAGAYYDLARAWLGEGNRAEARRATLRSLEIAPNFEKAQELLLKLREVAK